MLWIQEDMNKLGAISKIFNHTISGISFCVVEAHLCNIPGLLLLLYSLIPWRVGVIFFLEICVRIKQACSVSSCLFFPIWRGPTYREHTFFLYPKSGLCLNLGAQ